MKVGSHQMRTGEDQELCGRGSERKEGWRREGVEKGQKRKKSAKLRDSRQGIKIS